MQCSAVHYSIVQCSDRFVILHYHLMSWVMDNREGRRRGGEGITRVFVSGLCIIQSKGTHIFEFGLRNEEHVQMKFLFFIYQQKFFKY